MPNGAAVEEVDDASPSSRGDGERLVLGLLHDRRQELLDAWVASQQQAASFRRSTAHSRDLALQSSEVLDALAGAVVADGLALNAPGYGEVHRLLAELSAAQARHGYTPSETTAAVLSLGGSILHLLRSDLPDGGVAIEPVDDIVALVQGLALFTLDAHVLRREQVIRSQHEELLELSTPVVKLWEGVIAVPLIGTLDSQRTQMVMENVLAGIVEHEAQIAILDITGVPTVDTLVAQHLLKTVAATRLMGADCIISGIRPQIAETIVSLGVELGDVTTKPSMAGAFQVALKRLGYTVHQVDPAR